MFSGKDGKKRLNHGLSLTDQAPAIAVAIFAICIAGITFAGSALIYLFFDTLKNLAAFWVAFFFCPYDRIRVKYALFAILVNEVLATVYATLVLFEVNLIPYESGFVVPLIVMVFYIIALLRLQLARKIKSREPDLIEDCIYLIPIQTWQGLAQCLFMPWHNGRYESRAVCASGKLYMVHRNTFKCFDARLVDIPNHVICIPLGRRLTQIEMNRLDRLIGKSSLLMVRDCRKLTGAIVDY